MRLGRCGSDASLKTGAGPSLVTPADWRTATGLLAVWSQKQIQIPILESCGTGTIAEVLFQELVGTITTRRREEGVLYWLEEASGGDIQHHAGDTKETKYIILKRPLLLSTGIFGSPEEHFGYEEQQILRFGDPGRV